MKVLWLVLVAVCCLTACKKGESLAPGIYGKWELRRMYGGFGFKDSTYKAGNGNIYQFSSDSTYKYYVDGKLSKQGVYHYRKHSIRIGDTYFDALILGDVTPANISYDNLVSLRGDLMTLGTTVTDGIASDYEKIGN